MWKLSVTRHMVMAVVTVLCGCQSFTAPDEQEVLVQGDEETTAGDGLTVNVTTADVTIQDAPKGRAVAMRLSVSIANTSAEPAYYRHSCAVALQRKQLDTWATVWEPGLCSLMEMPLEEIGRGEVYSVEWPVQALLGSAEAEAWGEPIAGDYRFMLWIWRGDPLAAQVIHSLPFQVAAP